MPKPVWALPNERSVGGRLRCNTNQAADAELETILIDTPEHQDSEEGGSKGLSQRGKCLDVDFLDHVSRPKLVRQSAFRHLTIDTDHLGARDAVDSPNPFFKEQDKSHRRGTVAKPPPQVWSCLCSSMVPSLLLGHQECVDGEESEDLINHGFDKYPAFDSSALAGVPFMVVSETGLALESSTQLWRTVPLSGPPVTRGEHLWSFLVSQFFCKDTLKMDRRFVSGEKASSWRWSGHWNSGHFQVSD
jgi:hypothetical protein